MLTTIVNYNDIRLQSMESDSGKPCFQVNDNSRQDAGSLQARHHKEHQQGPWPELRGAGDA
jgi:hypothetical protein